MTPITRGLLPLLFLTLPASAQWSSDPASNVSIGDGASDQAQPKVVSTPDGGSYISWFDGIGSGYDVRLQRMDAAGNEMWAHNGILIADRGFSSTQDYGLDIDAAGNALVTYRDDSGANVQIGATQASPAGTILWSNIVTNTTGFLATPAITGTADGHVIVGWADNGVAVVQRLDNAGLPLWGTGISMVPPVGAYTLSDMHGSGTDVIVSIVHQTGSQFTSPKQLRTQKLDSSGANLWGASPVAVFDSGSLQIGNFPDFVTDGSGGAVFGWYGTSPLQCYAQRILANGTEAFPHNGSEGSLNGTQLRVGPSVSFDAGSGSTFIFWSEKNGSQSQSGLGGQMFDGTGTRQWGPNGVTLVGLSATSITWATTEADGNGAFVFWNESPSFGNDVLKGAHVNAAGMNDIPEFDVASTPSGKSRLASARSAAGQVVLAWMDNRVDGNDILGQNVNPDGSLGGFIAPGTTYCFGTACPCGNPDGAAGCANSTGSGALLGSGGSASVASDNLTFGLTGGPASKPSLLFAGPNQSSNAFGDGMLCVSGSIQRLTVVFTDGNGAANWGAGIASSQGWMSGDTRNFQVWYRDPAGPCSSEFNTSNGVSVSFQP
ncbi:MAG: hypothetical protein ACI9F9_001018 [Candidatus Paceibacteria bacterium]|jgi:hypothetical protein